jgi:hypothetical protein
MSKKIQVHIFGFGNQLLKEGCSSGGCGGCGSKDKKSSEGCGGCCNNSSGNVGCSKNIRSNTSYKSGESKSTIKIGKKSKDLNMHYTDLVEFLRDRGVIDSVDLKFIELSKINILDYDDLRVLYDMDFEPPYVVIDGIIRYYGGLSFELIYNDINELLQ